MLEFTFPKDVGDYFVWRRHDALRNCVSSHAYWALRKAGKSARAAHRQLDGVNTAGKIDLIRQLTGLLYSKIPGWQRYGVGLQWVQYEKEGLNPITNETVTAERQQLDEDEHVAGPVPVYHSHIRNLLEA